MRSLLVFAALVTCANQALSVKPFICYWESWSRYRPPPYNGSVDNIPIHLCTHVIYAFAGLNDKTWEIKSLEDWDINGGGFKQLVALKKRKSSLKVSFAIGGWSDSTQKYSQMASDADHRKTFAQSVARWVTTYEFDGVDLDWESLADPIKGGVSADKTNLVLLLKELRDALGSTKLLTAAVFSTTKKITDAYDVPKMVPYLDFIHVMTYDLRAYYDGKLGNHVALYSGPYDSDVFTPLTVSQGMRNWANAGAPKSKLIMGFGFYGHSFKLTNSNNHKPGDSSSGAGDASSVSQEAGTLFYFEICQRLKQGWTRVWDDASKTPYAYSGSQWVGYEDVQGIGHKTNLINKEGYGGAMVWAIGFDDPGKACGPDVYPLANAVVKGLKGGSKK